MKNYDHKKIEKKWQKAWEVKKLYKTENASRKKKMYILDMFPYPSAEGLHVGHPRGYIATDIYSRMKKMQGYNVLHPMGWDAFGLPAENFAIKNKIHPSLAVKKNVKRFKEQLSVIGFNYDWSREINTTDPAFYKWTQWIFLQMYKKGLAYESFEPINWCPECKTGLANEDVESDGTCERCGTIVEKKPMRQWVLKITDYADRMLTDLDKLPKWPEGVKEAQRNWIGRSEGSEIEFKIKEFSEKDKIVILHGRNGTSKNYFYPWLKKELEKTGATVFLSDLPNTNEPNDEEQADYVMKNISLDQNTTIITHSFGGIVAMRILERGVKIKGLIQFSTPLSGKFLDGKIRKSVTEAAQKGFDFEKIKKQANYFKVIFDFSDNIVPKKDQEILAKNLEIFPQAIDAKETHFCAKEETEMLDAILPKIKVFTTRADTLFGATYVVLAPEHELVKNLNIENRKEVEDYIKSVKNKTEIERTENKEKTGVELKGIKAINPANNEEIPVWISDYILANYGTGAVMAVPAHDERDFEFAKKYNLEMRRVVGPKFSHTEGESAIKEDLPFIKRNAICAIVRNPKNDKYLCISWKNHNMHGLVTGGIDDSEKPVEAALREIREETGYKNVRLVKDPNFCLHSQFYHRVKQENRWARFHYFFFELIDEEKDDINEQELKLHDIVWISKDEFRTFFTVVEGNFLLNFIDNPDYIFTGDGILNNSDEFNDLDSEEARRKITEFVGGKIVTKYKIKDWVFSRQRYWGEPIPIIHCEKCGVVPVPEKDLPIVLPKVKSYEPTGTGESPLANISSWVNVKCPKCKSPAKRETNTMPQWAGSSWYYLRFIDPKNKSALVDKKKEKYFSPVDVYVGGDHATRHLIYARFWHKFLYDIKAVSYSEPFPRLEFLGFILAEDGRKMSKRWKNVVNPDDMVKQFGADAFRLYEMFIGPFESTAPWSTNGLVGTYRFVERVWKLQEKIIDKKTGKEKNSRITKLVHKMMKKVGEDIEAFKFNTAVSSLMIFVNEISKEDFILKEDFKKFLQVLAPFAPHVSEELWSALGEKKSIHTSDWPRFDKNLIKDDEIKIAVQVNGKVRAEIMINAEEPEEKIKEKAKNLEQVKKHIDNKEIRKIIYVKNRLVNIVV